MAAGRVGIVWSGNIPPDSAAVVFSLPQPPFFYTERGAAAVGRRSQIVIVLYIYLWDNLI
jgi:hypothetical protein